MHAVVLRAFGAPDVLRCEPVADPTPRDGQVVVAVELVSVTFVETQLRSGRPPNPAMLPELPTVLGNGVGGTVAEVGAGADPSLVGRRIVTTTGGRGGYAERVAVDADELVDVPPSLALTDAVAVLADGRTALGLCDVAAPRAGERVLVEAAAGGVGSLLVQLARQAGATVVGIAGGARKVEVVRELGADLAVDSAQPGWQERVRDEIGALDVVFDGVGGVTGAAALDLLAENGRFVPYGMASGSFTALDDDDLTRRGVAVVRFVPRDAAALRALTVRALDATSHGGLRPIVGQTFPLDRAADAHAAIEARATIGKTLLVVEQPT